MGSFSLLHWIIVLAVILLLFGPKRLPDLAKGIGEAIREFKKAVNSPDPPKQLTGDQQVHREVNTQHAAAPKSPETVDKG